MRMLRLANQTCTSYKRKLGLSIEWKCPFQGCDCVVGGLTSLRRDGEEGAGGQAARGSCTLPGCVCAGCGMDQLARPGRTGDRGGDSRQTAQQHQAGLCGKDGGDVAGELCFKITQNYDFWGEKKHSELPKSELENGYCNCEHNGHTGTKAAFLVWFFFFFPSISINSLYYFITEIVCVFNEWEEHLQMPFCLKAKLLGVTELQGIIPGFRSSPFLCWGRT